MGHKAYTKAVWIFAAGVVCISAIILVAYRPALKAGAIFFGDNEYVFQNPLVTQPGLTSARRFFTEILAPSSVRGYYHPLAMTSLMGDYALGGRADNLTVFHLTSLCLHLANSLLVVLVVFLFFGRFWPALAAGLLFGLHPVNADSVVWIAERKTLLASFFSLWSVVSYSAFVKSNKKKFIVLSVMAYVLALLSKPTSVMLPFLLLLLDFWPLKRINKSRLIEKIPYFVFFVLAVVVTFLSQNQAGKVSLMFGQSLTRIPLLLCYCFGFYLTKAVCPFNLSAYYPLAGPVTISQPLVLWSVLVTVVFVVLMLLTIRKTRALVVGVLFFSVAILPTTGVLTFTDVVVANRFMYLPILGLLLPVAALIDWFLNTCQGFSGSVRKVVTIVIVLMLACFEFGLTRTYLSHWGNTESLYKYMLTSFPRSAVLHNNLGNALRFSDADEAIEHYKMAISLESNYVRAYNNVANLYTNIGQVDKAIEFYRKALIARPDPTVRYYAIHYNLGMAYLSKDDLTQAVGCFKKTVELRPDFTAAHEQLTRLLERQKLQQINEGASRGPESDI